MIFKGNVKSIDRDTAKTGSYLFNTNNIGEVIADSTDSVVKYTKNLFDYRNRTTEYKLDEATTVLDALLWTSSDAEVSLPVLKKKVDAVVSDYAYTVKLPMNKIAFGWADPDDATKSWLEVYPNGFKKILYQVNLSVAQISGFANILTYKFLDSLNTGITGGDVTGTIDYAAGTIALTVPAGSTVTALVASFTLNDGASAKISSTAQVSGTTANNFTTPKTYTVTSKYSNTKDFVVTVTVAS